MMDCMMNCNEARELFSPWLDGEMNEQERALFQLHMQQCASCRLELEQWSKISSALRELAKEELIAPSDFSSGIMQFINENQTSFKPAIRHWSKTAKSGIAAAILLLFTALAVNSGPVLQVADKSAPEPEKIKTHYAVSQKPKSNSPNPVAPVSNTTPNPSAPAKQNPVEPDTGMTNQQIASTPVKATESRPVFLNKERFFTTTMVKLKVAEPAAIQTQAVNIAQAAGAKTELLGQQNQIGSRFSVLKFTIANDNSKSLLNQLSALGNQISVQEEKQDLTARFSSALEQYRNLLDQRGKLKETEQIARLDKQIASLEEQLSSWDKEAQEESIVLWLEE